MTNWNEWNIGDNVKWETNEFDGRTKTIAEITEKHDDHLIAEADGMKLWIDDDTAYQFKRI